MNVSTAKKKSSMNATCAKIAIISFFANLATKNETPSNHCTQILIKTIMFLVKFFDLYRTDSL
jgi:hypothetical protein